MNKDIKKMERILLTVIEESETITPHFHERVPEGQKYWKIVVDNQDFMIVSDCECSRTLDWYAWEKGNYINNFNHVLKLYQKVISCAEKEFVVDNAILKTFPKAKNITIVENNSNGNVKVSFQLDVAGIMVIPITVDCYIAIEGDNIENVKLPDAVPSQERDRFILNLLASVIKWRKFNTTTPKEEIKNKDKDTLLMLLRKRFPNLMFRFKDDSCFEFYLLFKVVDSYNLEDLGIVMDLVKEIDTFLQIHLSEKELEELVIVYDC